MPSDAHKLDPHKRNWEDLAEVDPLWAILSNDSRQHGGWGMSEFLQSGERNIATLMETVERLNPQINHGSVLDFGCGVGRLTRAFASRFQTCYGVDISERMIQGAQELHQAYPNCHFLVNAADNLRIFPDGSFDLIYTSLVLQHIPDRRIINAYIREFMRTLNVGGMLVFQLPSDIPLRRRLQPRRRAYTALRAVGFPHTLLYNKLGLNPIKMNFIPERDVRATARSAGGQVDVVETSANPHYTSSVYYVTRQHPSPSPPNGAVR